MPAQLSLDEIAKRGETLYQDRLKAQLEAAYRDRFLILDIESGEYEIDADDMAAEERLRSRCPAGVFYTIRIGAPTAYFLGGGAAKGD